MQIRFPLFRVLLLTALIVTAAFGIARAADTRSSGFGEVVIPAPVKPTAASNCVEPVEIMRRDHMKFLLHQRDATVLQGERDPKYSLVGCMDCHNPASADAAIIRYENPEHFCASCHQFASVKIDCFECHADRGLENSQQSSLAPEIEEPQLSMQTFRHRLIRADDD